MKLIIDDTIYAPIYLSDSKYGEFMYDEHMNRYKQSAYVSKLKFKSLHDALTAQIIFWERQLDIEHDIIKDKQKYDRFIFEITGLHFYKFFYDSFEWFPFKLINYYDGIFMYDAAIHEISYNIKEKDINFKLEDEAILSFTPNDFLKTFRLKQYSDISQTVSEFAKQGMLYFNECCCFFLNEENYRWAMAYLNEQVELLNKIYADFGLKQMKVV